MSPRVFSLRHRATCAVRARRQIRRMISGVWESRFSDYDEKGKNSVLSVKYGHGPSSWPTTL